YYTVILALGVGACISAMMKMPLTAVVFSLEVFGHVENVLYVIVVVAVSFIITEIFEVKGINDSILGNLIKAQEETHERKIIDTHVTIKKGSFAEYRHARDITFVNRCDRFINTICFYTKFICQTCYFLDT
ncbi:MAG: chloride channel protein, partial [Alphaproteobacteria bacterium]|nr:chloride channel protein [Alphaproteobacteria bacterium]